VSQLAQATYDEVFKAVYSQVSAALTLTKEDEFRLTTEMTLRAQEMLTTRMHD